MEISTREKTLQIVSRYVIITLSISIMTIGVYFFKFPNNFVFGGVTGGAALVAKLTPLSASAFSSCANILLLILGWIFLGKDFAISTGWATVVMTAELALFEKYVPLSGPLSNQPMLDLVFAIALPAIASALLFNVGASSGGTDVVALILKKYTHMKNTGEALFITDLAMVLAACFVFDLYTALYSFVGLTVKSLVVDAHRAVAQGHGRGLEAEGVELRQPLFGPVSGRFAKLRPRHLKHRAHAHPHRATTERVAAGGVDEDGVHVQRRRTAEDCADVRGIHHIFEHGNAARICANLRNTFQSRAAHRT